MPNNSAFIDSQNLNLATQNLGWNLDWAKFRKYLNDTYHVETAYLFIGYMPEHQDIYSAMQKAGYIVIFKPVSINREGDVKGNVDAELVLHAMIDINKYDKAVIVTGDGDFASLVSHLVSKDKLECLIIPNQRQHSQVLRQSAKDHVSYLNDLRNQLQYRKWSNQSRDGRDAGAGKTATPKPANQPKPETQPAQQSPKPTEATAPAKGPASAPAAPQAASASPKPRRRRNNAEDNLMNTLQKHADPSDPV